MTASEISDQVRGKTIRLIWPDGPTKVTAHDHIFHDDGTVEWRAADTEKEHALSSGGPDVEAAKKPERPTYAGIRITEDVCLVSYLAQSGYTLTVTLNTRDGSAVGIASNEKTWIPVRGSFEQLG